MRSAGTILIADDDEFVLLSLKLLCEQQGFDCLTTTTPERIPALLEKTDVHAVLLDMNFRPGDITSTQGIFWLRQIRELRPDVPVIMVTAYGEIPLAVEAMKQGAFDFVTKPWDNNKLSELIRNAVALHRQKTKKDNHTSEKAPNSDVLVGESAAINDIRKIIDKIAETDACVLILGQNGTGKEVIARHIHQRSRRAARPFVSVDLGSLSETIFESELFGHKKGAFTDAKEDRVGRIESAEGGTVFLDEIGNVPLALQSKLLTLLQNKSVTRLGTNSPIQVDVRFVCATNSNLKKLVDEGKFREDLYYRMNTVEIHVPSLLDRIEDLPLLANHFLKKFVTRYDKRDRIIPDHVIASLQKYRWPGNIRELQHAVERAVILSDSPELTLADFGVVRNENSGDLVFDQLNLEKLEAWAIRKALDKHKGNVSHAASELGLSRGAMYRRMERYGVS